MNDEELQKLYEKIRSKNPLVEEYIKKYGPETFFVYFKYADTAAEEGFFEQPPKIGKEDLAAKLNINIEELDKGLHIMNKFLAESFFAALREPLQVSDD